MAYDGRTTKHGDLLSAVSPRRRFTSVVACATKTEPATCARPARLFGRARFASRYVNCVPEPSLRRPPERPRQFAAGVTPLGIRRNSTPMPDIRPEAAVADVLTPLAMSILQTGGEEAYTRLVVRGGTAACGSAEARRLLKGVTPEQLVACPL